MFKPLVLEARLYNLSDRPDRVSGPRNRVVFHALFWGLVLGDRCRDARRCGCIANALAQAGKVEELFGLFDGPSGAAGQYCAGGQILDASIVPVPPQSQYAAMKNAGYQEGEVPRIGLITSENCAEGRGCTLGRKSTARAITATRTT